MRQTFLEGDDMQWLSEVHYRPAIRYACAILVGNEDAPSELLLYARNNVRTKPTILRPNASGSLRVISWGQTFGERINDNGNC
jgi:hypothetical protein